MNTKDKLILAVGIAFNYGFQQDSNKNEPMNSVLGWCGYNTKVPKPFSQCLYEAYKLGKFESSFQRNRFKGE
jgi:hypothetical protein